METFSLQSFHGVIGIGLSICIVEGIVAQGLPLVVFAGHGPYTVGFDANRLRELGWDALRTLGCKNIQEIPADQPTSNKQLASYLWGKALFAQPKSLWPEGVLSQDDILTAGFLGAVREAGVPLGQTLQLATHANEGSPTLLGWESDIVRLEVSPREIIAHLFDLLEIQLRGETASGSSRLIPINTCFGDKLHQVSSSRRES